MEPLARHPAPITNDVVEYVTARLCEDTMAVIATLRAEDRQKYIDRMHDRTRRALEEAFSRAS